jgi:hypothetical protein
MEGSVEEQEQTGCETSLVYSDVEVHMLRRKDALDCKHVAVRGVAGEEATTRGRPEREVFLLPHSGIHFLNCCS